MRQGLALAHAGFVPLALLALACEGQILGSSEGGPPPGGPQQGGENVSAGPGPLPMTGPSDDELRAKDPELFDIALKYFPGQTASAGNKRMFRLTRAQLDATTQSLLPAHFKASAVTTLPRDPLQTNYEYAANLSFS